MGFGNGDLGAGNGDLGARRNEAEKDIAESPARSERPKKAKDKGLKAKELRI